MLDIKRRCVVQLLFWLLLAKLNNKKFVYLEKYTNFCFTIDKYLSEYYYRDI